MNTDLSEAGFDAYLSETFGDLAQSIKQAYQANYSRVPALPNAVSTPTFLWPCPCGAGPAIRRLSEQTAICITWTMYHRPIRFIEPTSQT